MKHSQLVTSAVLMVAALIIARPDAARSVSCPQLEPSFTVAGVSGAGSTQTSADQATLGIGGCATLSFKIVSQPGSVVTDVTHSANTTFTTGLPQRGTVTGNLFCVGAADCNHQFPVYGIYHDPCSNTNLVATVHITVVPCPVVSPAAGCPQIETLASILSVSGTGSTKNSSDQATVGIGGTVFVGLAITQQPGNTTPQDVTLSPNTTFTSGLTTGITPVGKNGFLVGAAACGHEFPIYATYFDTCTGTTITSPVSITTAPCPVVSPAAGCPQIETLASYASVNGAATTGNPDQATLSVGQCATLRLLISSQSGGNPSTVTDVTTSPNTTFASDRGTITGHTICVGPADANHQFAVYATYHDTCTGTTITSTLHLTVRPGGMAG